MPRSFPYFFAACWPWPSASQPLCTWGEYAALPLSPPCFPRRCGRTKRNGRNNSPDSHQRRGRSQRPSGFRGGAKLQGRKLQDEILSFLPSIRQTQPKPQPSGALGPRQESSHETAFSHTRTDSSSKRKERMEEVMFVLKSLVRIILETLSLEGVASQHRAQTHKQRNKQRE